MKQKLLRLTVAIALCVSSYGFFAAQITHAQCGCSCTYVCPDTCNFSCDGCDLGGLIDTAARCCSEEKGRTNCIN
jgi:hypothetical protein